MTDIISLQLYNRIQSLSDLFKKMRGSVDVLRRYLYWGLILVLGCLLVQTVPGTALGDEPQDPAAALGGAEQSEQQEEDQRLENLDRLSDDEVRDIYLNRPQMLPSELTDAEWQRIRDLTQTEGAGEGQ